MVHVGTSPFIVTPQGHGEALVKYKTLHSAVCLDVRPPEWTMWLGALTAGSTGVHSRRRPTDVISSEVGHTVSERVASGHCCCAVDIIIRSLLGRAVY